MPICRFFCCRFLFKLVVAVGFFFCFLMPMGCSPIKIKPQSTYLLASVNTQEEGLPAKTKWTILVSEPIPNPGYSSSAMIYMFTPYEIKFYANNRWIVPPAQMLGLIFVQAIQRQDYFHAVVYPPFLAIPEYRLETRLLKLQQEFMTSISQVRLVVEVSLMDNLQHTTMATRRFEVLVPAPSNNPSGGVFAANRAAALISQQVADFCIRRVSQATSTSSGKNP